jgi:glycerate kinase
VTGEGRLDAGSFEGKVVGGVAAYAAAAGVPLLVVAGRVDPDVTGRVEAISLVDRFGEERALEDTLWCVEEAVSDHLGALGRGGER